MEWNLCLQGLQKKFKEKSESGGVGGACLVWTGAREDRSRGKDGSLLYGVIKDRGSIMEWNLCLQGLQKKFMEKSESGGVGGACLVWTGAREDRSRGKDGSLLYGVIKDRGSIMEWNLCLQGLQKKFKEKSESGGVGGACLVWTGAREDRSRGKDGSLLYGAIKTKLPSRPNCHLILYQRNIVFIV